MTGIRLWRMGGGIVLLCAVVTAGCATVDRKVNLLYQPAAHETGGSGTLHLAAAGAGGGSAGTTGVQWIVGKVAARDGEKKGDVVLTTAPYALVVDALREELANAGYAVTPVAGVLPGEAAKGVDVVGATVELDETSDLVRSEGVSKLSVTLELWKKGTKIRKLEYRSLLSDFAVKDRDLLLPTLLQKTLQEVMKQAVPEVIRTLEQ